MIPHVAHQHIVLPLVIWVFTKVIPFAPIPTMFDMWYCPFPISTWLTTLETSGNSAHDSAQ